MLDFLTTTVDYRSTSDIGDFRIGTSPVEGVLWRGWYSSAIGLFAIGKSPIGMPPFLPGNNYRRVVFTLPDYLDTFRLEPELSDFVLPIPEGWAS
jgi:hypothetical protein